MKAYYNIRHLLRTS